MAKIRLWNEQTASLNKNAKRGSEKNRFSITGWMLGEEIDSSRLGADVFAGTVDPDICSHDFVIWLRQSHVAIQHRFVGS